MKELNYLLIGGAGFLGSHLAARMLYDKHFIVLDNLSSGSLDNLHRIVNPEDHKFIYGDAADLQVLCNVCIKNSVDIIINAATAGLPQSLENPEFVFLQEITIAKNICQALRLGYAGRLVHISTSEVYGNADEYPININIQPKPQTTYAAGKASADILIETYRRLYGINAMIIRPFNMFGERQAPEMYSALMPKVLKSIFSGDDIIIHGDGYQTRDYMYVKDTVTIILKLIQMQKHEPSYLICSEQEIHIIDFVHMIIEEAQTLGISISSNIRFNGKRQGDLTRLLGENNWRFGDYKQTPINIAIKNTIKWYQNYYTKEERGYGT